MLLLNSVCVKMRTCRLRGLQGRVVALTADVNAPGIRRLRFRFQLARGVAAT
jgi:hypothetical protein